MKSLIDHLFSFKKAVTFNNVKIYHETETAVLVELNDQTIWLPKDIIVSRKRDLVNLKIPFDLLRKKFPPKKYKQFAHY